MRIRAFSDLHLQERKDWGYHSNGVNKWLRHQLDVVEKVCEGGGSKPPYCVFCGDIAHSRTSLTSQEVWAIKAVLEMLNESFGQTYVIPGNHDNPLRSGGPFTHLTAFAKMFHRLEVVQEPCIRVHSDGVIALQPWRADSAQLAVEIEDLADQVEKSIHPSQSLLATHVGLRGAKVGTSGYVMKDAMDSQFLFSERFNVVVLGDYHLRQQVKPGIWYCGSPIELNWGEAGESKGFLDINIVPDGFDISWGAIDGPKHKLIEVSNGFDLMKAKEQQSEGNIIKVVLAENAKVGEQEAVDLGLAVERLAHIERAKTELGITLSSSIMDIVDSALDAGIQGPGLARNTLRTLLEKVVDESRELKEGKTGQQPEVTLTSVEAENILSYKSLAVNLEDQGVVLIEGINEDDPTVQSNGSGKSNIFDIISFGLFGKPLRPIPVASIPRRGVKEGWYVRIDLKVRDHEVIISRAKNNSDYSDGLNLWLDGEDVTPGGDQVKAQEQIKELTGLDHRLFKQFVVFGQGVDTDFGSATNAERKEILEALCGGKRFEACYEIAKDKHDKMDIRLTEATTQGQQLKRDEQTCCEHIERYKEIKEHALKERTARIKELGIEVEVLAQTIEGDGGEKSERQANRVKIRELIDKAEEKLEALAGDGESVAEINARINADIPRHKQLQAELKQAKEEKVCPTCKRPTSDKRIVQLLQDAIDNLTESSKVWKDKLRPAQEAEAKIVKGREFLSGLKDTERNELAEIRILTNKISDNTTRLGAVEKQIKELKETSEEFYDKPIRDEKKRWEENQQAQVTLSDKMGAMKRALSYLEEAKRLFGNNGLKTYLFQLLQDQINLHLSDALAILSEGALSALVSTKGSASKQELILTVDNLYGADNFHGNSGGEKQKINLALLWALNKLMGSQVNLLLIDEAFDGLDSLAASRVVDLLNSGLRENGTILVVTHNSEFNERFPIVWTARKKSRTTQLETSN